MTKTQIQDNIGKRVKINGNRDLAFNGSLRKFIFDNLNEHILILEKITKGGKACIKYKKELLSVNFENIDAYED